MAATPERKPTGTQTLERALDLQKVLTTRAHQGWRLVDLAQQCNLDKGTAHRILSFLVQERLARQRPSDRHYFPGPLLFELGLSLGDMHTLVAESSKPLAVISKKLGATSYLYLRSGVDFVCAARSGSVNRGLLVDVGSRFPLIYSAGGVAILIAMANGEARTVVAENLKRLRAARDRRLDGVQAMLRRSRIKGYAINLGDTTAGIHAFGIGLRNADGIAFGALVVAGDAHAMPAAAAPTIVAILRGAAQDLAPHSAKLRL